MEDAFNVETVRVLLTNIVFEVRVDMAMVDAMREDPLSVENSLRDSPGTLMVDAFNVETVRVLLINIVLEFKVEMAMVDAIIEDPVSVEN